MNDGSRNHGKANELNFGGRLSDYLLPCHPYGDNHTKQREFEINIIALMAHALTSLSLVDHECFRKMTQDLDPQLRPATRSKMSRSLIPT